MQQVPPTPEEQLLRDALALDETAVVALVSREPLGAGSVAGFEVAAPGDQAMVYFVDTSGRQVARETGLTLGAPDAPDGRVWLHPADPHLPALAPVAFAQAAETLLSRLGLVPDGAPEFVAYRPGRRAVLRVPIAGDALWVKVVPPSRIARIVDTHRTLASRGIPVPGIRGWSDDGLLVLEAAAGRPVTDAPWECGALLDEVDRLRATLSDVELGHHAHTGLDRRLGWYAARLRAVLDPARAAIVVAVEREARARWGDSRTETTVHGDLHFGQLFLGDDQRVSAVIDVDTAGRGIPSDDTASFVAHAVASAVLTPAPRDERLWELARTAMRRWDAAPGAGDGLRARVATHLLGHALGAVEVGHDRHADALLDAASAVSGDGDALGPA